MQTVYQYFQKTILDEISSFGEIVEKQTHDKNELKFEITGRDTIITIDIDKNKVKEFFKMDKIGAIQESPTLLFFFYIVKKISVNKTADFDLSISLTKEGWYSFAKTGSGKQINEVESIWKSQKR